MRTAVEGTAVNYSPECVETLFSDVSLKIGRLTDALLTDALVNLAAPVRRKEKGRFGLRETSRITDSQLTELHNMRVLLEEARGLGRNLAYHRRASLEASIGQALDEVDRQIEAVQKERP